VARPVVIAQCHSILIYQLECIIQRYPTIYSVQIHLPHGFYYWLVLSGLPVEHTDHSIKGGVEKPTFFCGIMSFPCHYSAILKCDLTGWIGKHLTWGNQKFGISMGPNHGNWDRKLSKIFRNLIFSSSNGISRSNSVDGSWTWHSNPCRCRT